MAYEISIDDTLGIAEIRFLGAMPHREHVKARGELIETCRTRNIRKILIDARKLAGAPTMVELYDFAASWQQRAQPSRFCVAGVVPEDPDVRKWWTFGDNVSFNRGFATRAFADFDQAKAWLRDA